VTITPLQERFRQVRAPDGLFSTSFAGVLPDGFALTAAGGYAGLRELFTTAADLRELADLITG
jgi:2-haloacid dehalogenase